VCCPNKLNTLVVLHWNCFTNLTQEQVENRASISDDAGTSEQVGDQPCKVFCKQQEKFSSWCMSVLQESWFSIGFILRRFLLICQLRKPQFNIHLGKVFLIEKLWEHYLRTGWEQYPGCSEYKKAKSISTKYFLTFLDYKVCDFYEIFFANFLSLENYFDWKKYCGKFLEIFCSWKSVLFK